MKNALLLTIVLSLGFLAGCGHQPVVVTGGMPGDGRYDLIEPMGGNAGRIHDLLESVRMINATAYYERYNFAPEERVTVDSVNHQFLSRNKKRSEIYTDNAVGTATIIYKDNDHVAALTCAHVVEFEDTTYIYYADINGEISNFLYQVAIKRRQELGIADIKYGDNMQILAVDSDLDVAIIGKKLPPGDYRPIPTFNFPFGRAEELDWGSKVILVGFPAGKKMITSGMVSPNSRDRGRDFLVDALFNRGFSGGIVMAIRDGIPNFELVGIVSAVAADEEAVLIPDPSYVSDRPAHGQPYIGRPIISPRKVVKYGV
ncbi:MAG: trypsin-like peptidase domain-containing protein, partial [Calditrichaeota bacterium]|nr:trypsin-like peptidase domain-containing protein [Calditrichota bacterium]